MTFTHDVSRTMRKEKLVLMLTIIGSKDIRKIDLKLVKVIATDGEGNGNKDENLIAIVES